VDCSVEVADEATAGVVARECGHEVEVIEGRTEWNTVWAQPDGNMRLDVSTTAVRTQVGGDWAEIDTTVVAGEGGLEVTSPVAEIVFSDGSDGEPLARMVSEGHEITMDAPFELTDPQVLGDSVMYPEVLPGVDLVVSVNADGTGFSEVLRIESAEAAANPALAELVFPIETSDGLDVAAASGGFTARDGAGEAVFVSPVPAMWDSSATRALTEPLPAGAGILERLVAAVTQAAAGVQDAAVRLEAPVPGDEVAQVPVAVASDAVSLAPDQAMFGDDDTAWPVFVDPSLGMTSPTERLAVRSGYSNYYNLPDSQGVGLCNRADPYGSSCPATFTSRLLYEFGGLDLIAGMTSTDVIRATFTVYGEHSYSCTPTNVQLYRVTPFSSGTGWPGGTWLSLLQTHTISHKASCGTQRWVEFDATAAADAIANENATTLAFGLKAADESTMSGWKRYRWDAQLSVVYNRPPNKPSNVRVVNGTAVQQCTDGGTAFVGPNGANLAATLSDPDQGSMLRGNFNLYTEAAYASAGAGAARIFDPEWTASQASGLSHSVTLPSQIDAEGDIVPGLLTHGGRYVLTIDATDQDPNFTRWGPKTLCTLVADFEPPVAQPTIEALPVPPGAIDMAQYVSGGDANGGVGVPGNFAFSYPQADDIAGYRYAFNDDSASAWVAGAAPTLPITPRGFGPQFLRVQAVDKAGNVGPAKVYDFVVSRSGPASEWRFDSGTVGATAPDNTAVPDVSEALGDYSLTTWGSPTWAQGSANGSYPYGSDRAMRFGGSRRAVAPAAVVRTDESFTVMAMVRLTSIPSGASATAVSQDGTNVAGFSLGYRTAPYCANGASPGCWSFFMYGSDGVSAPITSVESTDVPVEAGQWVQLAGMYDAIADETRLMVCTVPTATDSQVLVSDDTKAFTTAWNASGKLRVGMAMQGASMVRAFPGDISGVRVYAGVADDADFSRACSKGYWDMPLDPSGDDVDTALPAQSQAADSVDAPVAEMPDAPTMGAIWTAGGIHTVVAGRDANGTATLPISLVTDDASVVGEQATVELLDHADAVQAGVNGLLFEITPAPASTDMTQALTTGDLKIAVDTAGFAGAYGGGYAERLRVVQMPACAATEQAGQPECQVQTPVVTENNGSGQLMATLPAGSTSGGTYAVTAGTAGSTGDWSATSLSPSASWEVSAQSGNFAWSYPMRVPPGLGGPEPELSLDYSSGSVDGRVSSTNNQASWIGDGWDLSTGYIERQFVSCSEDMAAPANNAGHETSDFVLEDRQRRHGAGRAVAGARQDPGGRDRRCGEHLADEDRRRHPGTPVHRRRER